MNDPELRQRLQRLIDEVSDDRATEILEFAEFIESRRERQDWNAFALHELDKSYAADEPEYTAADIRG